MKKLHLIILIQFFSLFLISQVDSCWTVLLVKKGTTFKQKSDMASYSTSGFHLYRNCVYDFTTKKGDIRSGRLIDIKPDTLFFSNCFNEAVANKNKGTLDTLAFHFRALDKLRVIGDRSLGLFQKYSLAKYDFIFEKEVDHCRMESYWEQIYVNDSTLYEIVPHFTAQGIGLLYEELGNYYYFQGGGLIKPDYSKIDTTYSVKNGAWFTPCTVEKINGLAIGILPENMKNDFNGGEDSLTINGLNIDLMVFGWIAIFDPPRVGILPDSIEYYEEIIKEPNETQINGMNISVSNWLGYGHLKGLNIAGLFTTICEIHGVSISGISNFSYKFNGLSIAALHNRTTKGRGVDHRSNIEVSEINR